MSINQTVENVYLRQDAVRLTRKHFWRLLGMLLLIVLIAGVLDTGLTALGDLLLLKESQDVIDAAIAFTQENRISSANTLLEAQTNLLTSPKYLLFNLAFILITGLMNAALSLGRHAQMLEAARGGKPRILGVFCRMRQCLKGWLLSLWVTLKLGLWAIPGLILISADTALWQGASSNWLTAIGIGLVLGLVIPAALRYCLATFILADDPDRGVRECVTLSKGLMAGRKWQCFKLGVPAVLKMLGMMYGFMILLSIPMAFVASYDNSPRLLLVILVLAALIGILLVTLYFSIQFDLAYALFYLKRREPVAGAVSYWLRDQPKEDPAKAAPVSYWLRDHAEATPAPAAQEAPESPDAPAESPADSPEDTAPKTNEEKENHHE